MPLSNLLIIALTAAFSMACYGVAAKNRFANQFAEVLDVVEREALKELPPQELFDSAVTGLVKRLDMHSQYFSGVQYQYFQENMRQEFGGVGMYVGVDPETSSLRVTAAMPNTPAFEAKLMPGDLILEIEGKPTAGLESGEGIDLIRGKPDTDVHLLVDGSLGRREVTLTRGVIEVESVHGDTFRTDGTWDFRLQEDERIGYIRLLQFGEKSVEEFRAALQQLDGKIDGLIVDLRNNSGGLLTAAVSICDMFLDDRLLVVQTRGRGNQLIDSHFSSKQTQFNPNTPVVILINRESASASEIVAACLRDYKRAVLIGETTWGKGTVQNVIPIRRDQSALKLTIASYWPPSGKNFDRDLVSEDEPYGVHPDAGYEVEMTPEEIEENFIQRHRRDLRLLRQNVEPNPEEYIDQPLQRAIEHFESLARRRQAA